MEKVRTELVSILREHPDGIPLKKLAIVYNQTYHKNLTLSKLGFDSMTSLVSSLERDLVLEEELVFHRDHRGGSPALKRIVKMMKGHPDGIPLKLLTAAYKQKYNCDVSLVSMGFKTVSCLVDSLNEDLVVVEDVVYHKSHRPHSQPQAGMFTKTKENSRPTTPRTPDSLIRSSSPFIDAFQVMGTYQLTAPSMEQLQTCYSQKFGEKFPLAQYMSLYDNWEAKKLPTQSQPTTNPKTGVCMYYPPTATQSPKPEKEQEQASGLSFLSASDFPVLGADLSLTKEQKTKVRDANQREGSGPVFNKGYHAQLRELLGENMRAVEAMEADQEDFNGRRRNRDMDQDTINSLMESVIREIAGEGELVTTKKVISRVCRLVPSLDPRSVEHLPLKALKDLQYLIREINMFIEVAVTSICTLYELGQSLAGLKDKKRYEELNLGPLCKLPFIHRMFKIDSNTKDDDIHQIETVDILKQLRVFRRKQSKVKVDLAEFMKHLADHYNCDSPYELGIRITGLGLPISTLSKVGRNEYTILECAREVIQKELEEEIYERLRKLKKSILEPLQGAASFSSVGSLDLRKKYASMTAAEVVLAVFTNAGQVFSPRMAKHVQNFLLQVSGNRLETALFQLAICGGSLAVPHDLVPKDKTSKPTEKTKPEDKSTKSLPSEAKLKQYLRDKLAAQNSAITLAHIASLEKKLPEHFHVKDFLSLEKGSFLEFLVNNIQVLLQDTVGSTLILGSSMERAGSGFRPSKQDVFEFIKQCGDLSYIESALRSHYGVRDSRDLGHGPLHRLADLVQRQKALGGGGMSPICYESALFLPLYFLGRLGEMSKDQALASLLSCPLLEDLSEWSQWELIFKPLHGSLKEFIEKNAGNTGLAALEVTPGVLFKITTDTGDKHFSSATTALDPVGTAGHLVSMVVADGIVNAPIALLSNHMQSSLAAAVAKEDLSLAEEDVSCYDKVAKFLLECLTRIPTRTCQALLLQVFLEPFSLVLGQAKSKRVLMTVAQSEPRYMNCLHRLGILLGIPDWIKDYEKKLNPPQSQSYNTYSAPVDQAKVRDFLEDNIMDNSFESSQLYNSLHQVNDEQDIEAEEEEEDEEQLYELASVPNGEISDISSDAEGGQGEEQLKMSDGDEKEGDSCESEDTIQRAVIEDIRKSEFGIGVKLTAEGQKLMQVHQERLGRSLDRLSTELYSKDTHFVLELIQNADDNSYPAEPGVVPALAFMVERDCITVLNNETGFQEKNIRAICDVGRSTKGKHKYGYIGQKGIGFKSVFKVTDCPEIHSNGFHLRFDKNCGPMGYILPHWTEDTRPLDPQLKDINQHSWTTKISLPLRTESHQTRNLFHDVHPSLLLFLHRLRSITIYNQSEKRFMTMTRKDLNHNVLEVEHSEGTERWLVVKTTLKPKKIKEDVESTELALAFQLGSDSTGSNIVCQPQKQPVFAYLPLRSFGFRFIIQGDFDIPSSREDVDRDSSWNQWLRSEIAQLFLQAMDVFTNHPEFKGLKGLCQFLQFIPLSDEVLDFFKPVAGQIIQLLKGKSFLPTLSSDGKIVYKLPSQVAVCQDPVIREVIGGGELEKHLSLSYLHPDLSPAPPTSLLTHLGVRYLRGTDVTIVTTAMAKELMTVGGIHSDAGLHQLARLLVCNFRALEHGYGEADSILQTLRELPIIPLADGRAVALSVEGVFFPMEERPLAALYKDVSVVHPSLLSCLEPLESQQVRELLRRLGVHELEPQELLEQHIYPTIRNNKWKPTPVVVSYLVFIKQHSSSSQEYSDTAVPVLTSRGLLCPANERVHFSEEYGNVNLPTKLPGYDWILLSPCYVQTDGDVAGWRELFSKLGIKDGLIIRKQRQTLTASSPWSVESATWHQVPGEGYVLDDYPCEEFHALATAELPGSLLLQQRMALLELLEANWETGHCYSQYLTAQVIDSDGQPIKSTKSSFYHSLCRLEWVSAYCPQQGGQLERKYLCPSSVYLSSPEVINLLGTHVYYVNISSSDFSRALVDVLINYLKEWCVKPEEDVQEQRLPKDESEGATFTSTVQHIHNVYTYLQQNCSQSSLKELFQHTPAVFIEYNRHSDNWCYGRFYHLKEVCWSDPTNMFQRYKELTRRPDSPVQEPKVLSPFYSPLEDMKDFFLRLLNVDNNPKMNQYVGLLELICSSCPIPTAEVLQDVSILYARLAKSCKSKMSGDQERIHNYCSPLKGMVSDKKVFPTKDNNWVSLAHKPMISDSKELEKIFKPHKQVRLLNLPPPEKKTALKNKTGNSDQTAFNEKDRQLFLEICGIHPLSKCVKSEPLTENLRPCPAMQSLIRWIVPYIQRFLYHHDELNEVYSELTEQNIAGKIKHLYFAQVGKLYIRHQLDVADGEDPVIELVDVICLLKDKKELYIQKDNLSADLDICRFDPRALKRFLAKEEIRELPSEEELWEVPEPPKPDIPPERVEPSRPGQEDGEQTLVCWPPRAPIHSTGGGQEDSKVVEAVMKMWPPPAGPKEQGLEKDVSPRGSNHEGNYPPRSNSSTNRPAEQPILQRVPSHPEQANTTAAANTNTPPPPGYTFKILTNTDIQFNFICRYVFLISLLCLSVSAVPEAVVLSGTFQGTAADAAEIRPPLNLDFPQWSKSQATLEDMELTCQRPTTVVLSEDEIDVAAIGEWGEQLVNSFLCQWRDSSDPVRPTHVMWCNQSGETGQPYDFKLTFRSTGEPEVVYVEVKSTIKKEKSFIHMSANELDFALKERERYHIYRVYSAGDAQNVRLCRIQNLAQHLHTKDLALYLFV
uniref:Wu:fj29h11 n=1 Tax=Oreochromis niloticus TaxID=8128 RepID=A0A669E4X7_ORENI